MSGFLNIFGKGRGSSSKEDKEKSSKGGNIMNIGTPTNVVHGIHVSKNNITGDLEGLPRQWQRVMDTLITQDEQQENPDAVYSAVKFYNYSIKKKDQLEPFKPFITEEAIHEESAEIENYMTKTHYKSEDSLGKSSTNSSEDNFKLNELEERPAMPLPDVAPLVPPRESPSPPPPIPEKRPATLPPKPKLMPKPKILNNNNHNSQNSHILGSQKKKNHELSKPLDDLSKISCIEAVSPASVPAAAPQKQTYAVEEGEEEGELILREKDQTARKRIPKTDEEVYEELRTICNLDDPTLRYQTKVEVRGCSLALHMSMCVWSSVAA